MIYARIFIATSVLLFAAACSAANTSLNSEKSNQTTASSRTYAQNYKDMVLAYCIAKAYAADPHASKDATATAGGLDQWSNYDAEEGASEIPKLVGRYLSRQYHSIQGEQTKLDLLKCIDMYHSKELDVLVKKYVQNPQHTYIQDNPDSLK